MPYYPKPPPKPAPKWPAVMLTALAGAWFGVLG